MGDIKKPAGMRSICDACAMAPRCRAKKTDVYWCSTYKRTFCYYWDNTCRFIRELAGLRD